jgi:uncharacterized protein YqfB (UPF0267 family)
MRTVVEMGECEFDVVAIKEVSIFSLALHHNDAPAITQSVIEDFVNRYYPESYDFWYDRFERELRVKSYKVQ